jgi:hypothetical protein
MVPTDQSLGTHYLATATIDNRLKLQRELITLQRVAHRILKPCALLNLLIHAMGKEVVAITPGLLGTVHGQHGTVQRQQHQECDTPAQKTHKYL